MVEMLLDISVISYVSSDILLPKLFIVGKFLLWPYFFCDIHNYINYICIWKKYIFANLFVARLKDMSQTLCTKDFNILDVSVIHF
jgi:hypothetical protein